MADQAERRQHGVRGKGRKRFHNGTSFLEPTLADLGFTEAKAIAE